MTDATRERWALAICWAAGLKLAGVVDVLDAGQAYPGQAEDRMTGLWGVGRGSRSAAEDRVIPWLSKFDCCVGGEGLRRCAMSRSGCVSRASRRGELLIGRSGVTIGGYGSGG